MKSKEIKKKILLPRGAARELAIKFNIVENTVWRALTYQRDSDIARMIRRAALEMGGRLYDGTRSEEDAGKIIVLRQGETLEQYRARTTKQ